MKYTRDMIDDKGLFSDIFPDLKLYKRPNLPTFEFTKNKTKYTITDLRLLNPIGVNAFEICLEWMTEGENQEECRLACDKSVSDNDIEIAIDIVCGFSISANRKGKNGFYVSICAIPSVTIEEHEDSKILIFKFNDMFNKSVYEYRASTKSNDLNLADFSEYIINNYHKYIKELEIGG